MTKTTKSEFARTNINESGIYPSCDRVIVKQEEVLKPDLIELPEDVKERQNAAGAIGHIIAIGETAWLFEELKYHLDLRERYQPGRRVIFAMYGGQILKGKDGKEYRLIRDADVLALCDEDVKQKIR